MPAPVGPAELSFGPGPGERAEADQPAPFPTILPREVRGGEVTGGWVGTYPETLALGLGPGPLTGRLKGPAKD